MAAIRLRLFVLCHAGRQGHFAISTAGLEEIMQVMYQTLLNLVKIIKTCRLSILILSLQLGLESILQTHRPVSDLDY